MGGGGGVKGREVRSLRMLDELFFRAWRWGLIDTGQGFMNIRMSPPPNMTGPVHPAHGGTVRGQGAPQRPAVQAG